ncbi:uncharacterized protein LOC101857675 [Aplysia californica]|uniref:Uncharacterized protein LOC101857675 n=1 Tax=Aplysia californica TaxID=6500 RepID=A0ABM0K3V7_APLCA|nr:uncharacterized protein LOC101857675 [Aplysia californica]
MTSEKTSVITTMPRFTGMSSTVAPDVTTEAGDNYVTTVPLTAEPRNTSARVTPAGKVQRSTAASGTLGTGYIIFIVIIIVAIIVLAAAVGIYIKRRFYPTNSHGKLVEEHNPANFYKIDPATGEDSVTIDSGIVNPSYDYMNGAGNASGNSSTSAAAKSTQ